ncbi:MAG: amino acid ABC transporter permease [Solibacillus sp.]|jgi:L-cystine transport system permease protein|uniref:amino acid ABC transporter permease n=1 Tax=Solibacillus sp. TaxID=1909654 RepID=UPI0033150268
MIDISYVVEFLPKLISYLPITLEIFFLSLVLGLLLGILIAIPRLYNIQVLKSIATIYVSFIRGTPILIQLFLIFYGLPAIVILFGVDLSRMDAFIFVIITYTLHNGGQFAEIFRAAVKSVDYGQTEAAQAIGMSSMQIFIRIVFPQAFRIALPNIGNAAVSSLKDTSLAFSIGVMDMMGRGDTLIAATMKVFEVYIGLAIIYYVIVLIIERLFNWFEKYFNRHLRLASTGG